MKRPQLVSQGTLVRLLKTADEARSRRQFEQCIELLERASRLDPANTNILLNLGHAHGNHFDYAAAERCFERAIRLAPKKAEAIAGAGVRALSFGNHKLAERYYRLAAEQKDISPETLVGLSEICERSSRPEEAAQLIDRALRLSPAFPPALLVRARLARQGGRMIEAEKILQAFPTESGRDVRARAHYEMGAILDRQGRYDEAIAAFLRAKALLQPDARIIHERQIMRSRLKHLRECLTPELLERWFDAAPLLQPTRRLAMLCGHPRSGTTLLEQVLDSHPDAISAEETDIFHNEAYLPLTRGFPDDAPILSFLDPAPPEMLLKSRASYFRAAESFLETSIAGRLLVDKNPSLTYLIAAVIRIFPEAKFLVAFRDPRDVCLSCFMQPFVPVGQTTSAYLNLESTAEEYIELMEMYRTVVSQMRNPHLIVRYEDMVHDLESASKRVFDFLGLCWDANVLRFNEHVRQKVVRSPTYADVAKPVFKRAVGRWRNYQKHLEPCLEKLAPLVKAFGYE